MNGGVPVAISRLRALDSEVSFGKMKVMANKKRC